MNVFGILLLGSESLSRKMEFLWRTCLFYYPPVQRCAPSDISSNFYAVGDPIEVRHANAESAEWYAIRGRFMRVTLWEGTNANAYVVVKQEKRGVAVITTIQPYRIV